MVTILKDNLDGEKLPVYNKYSRCVNAQDAYLEVDLDEETVGAESNPEIGNGVPMSVWNGVVRRIKISPYCDGDAIIEFLEDEEIQKLLDRMIEGATIKRDEQCNWVGRLDEDGEQAEREIEDRAAEIRQNSVQTASDWLHEIDYEWVDRFAVTLKAGGKIDVDAEVQAIENDPSNHDDGDGNYLLLENVDNFVEDCLKKAREKIEDEEDAWPCCDLCDAEIENETGYSYADSHQTFCSFECAKRAMQENNVEAEVFTVRVATEAD